MSRSRKHIPVAKLKNNQYFKRLSNKVMRRKKVVVIDEYTIEHFDGMDVWPEVVIEYDEQHPIKYEAVNQYDVCDYRSRPATKNDSWYDEAVRK